jgi:hypothetical protein
MPFRGAPSLQFRAWPYKVRPATVVPTMVKGAIRRDALAMQFRAFPYKMRPATAATASVVGGGGLYIPTFRRRRRH